MIRVLYLCEETINPKPRVTFVESRLVDARTLPLQSCGDRSALQNHHTSSDMHPFGGTQICPRCSKAVYAAEQVMGPGRKLYHKPCLSCMICKKRLDSYTLVEHDQEPYCKSCYTKNFSARDLRQANLPVRESSTSPTGSSPDGTSSVHSLPPRVASPVRKSNTSAFPLPRLKPTHSLQSPASSTFPQTSRTSLEKVDEPRSSPSNQLDPSPEQEEATDQVAPLNDSSSSWPIPQNNSAPAIPNRPTHNSSYSIGSNSSARSFQPGNKGFSGPSFSTLGRSNNTTSTALNLLEKEGINPLVQTSTGTRYGAALGGTMSINVSGTPTGGSPARRWNVETPICPKCSQRVYFAEQSKAVGKTWHKNCLRCQECNTLLDSNRLRDHDGTPFCVRCYSKLHGPQGSGYALLGKAGA
ncbi:hypothetical protein NP233_g6824 [Leucocoprinus birnbaumii]|uniref:Cysteine-rich protein 1 n=1 Tax=Leucocoprinus birnbaumii TaxID=56174 RepID=A0AAD5VT40_9AGAR|nr:hypothetical protein NP233_g6824 [Leucocoprinus birnbaumii]